MGKLLGVIALVVAIVAGVLWFAGESRVSGTLGLSGGSSDDARIIEKGTLDFLEDVRFKDFAKAATYHSLADQKTVDVPRLIEDIFHIKPELLDILRYEVVNVELDSTKTRGRVKTRTTVRILNTDKVEKPAIIFYWEKDHHDGVWVMKLQSSLR